ncbi:hypothetical protein EVI01_06860 [Enterococcus villorum]|uniref:Uncharacterized protein n=1 Tax=Enterococcus villorum TaxID=112904 RepID=A0A511J109_9ENTE|nr:hypothetical protein EVI01_06860 [Enterococcus villorum]
MNLTANECRTNDLKEKKINNHLYRKVEMYEIRTKNLKLREWFLFRTNRTNRPRRLGGVK